MSSKMSKNFKSMEVKITYGTLFDNFECWNDHHSGPKKCKSIKPQVVDYFYA